MVYFFFIWFYVLNQLLTKLSRVKVEFNIWDTMSLLVGRDANLNPVKEIDFWVEQFFLFVL